MKTSTKTQIGYNVNLVSSKKSAMYKTLVAHPNQQLITFKWKPINSFTSKKELIEP